MTLQVPTLTPREFVTRWRDAGFGERQGAQSFFNDLCGLVGHPTPAAYGEPETFTFEKSIPGGFADAYFEERFGWEFKGQGCATGWSLRPTAALPGAPEDPAPADRVVLPDYTDPDQLPREWRRRRYNVGIQRADAIGSAGAILRDVFFAPHRFRERLRSVDAVTRETAALFQSIVVDMEATERGP